jgi:hypothetical protein
MSGTTVVTLSQNGWTSIGTAPAQVGVSGGVALLGVADSVPAPDALGFVLRPNDTPMQIRAQGQMWGRALSALETTAIVLSTAAAA